MPQECSAFCSFSSSLLSHTPLHHTVCTTPSGYILQQLTEDSSSPFQVNMAAFRVCWDMCVASPVLASLPGALFSSRGIYILGGVFCAPFRFSWAPSLSLLLNISLVCSGNSLCFYPEQITLHSIEPILHFPLKHFRFQANPNKSVEMPSLSGDVWMFTNVCAIFLGATARILLTNPE